MKQIEIPGEIEPIEAIVSETSKPTAMLILAHGAGAGMNHSFMEILSQHLKNNSIDVLRFNFPYITLGKKFPGSPKPNIRSWNLVIDWVCENYDTPLFIGGKSYGGRMASHLISETNLSRVLGLLYYGFPLHAPGRDSMDRAQHLVQVDVPQLFLQGTRDALANLALMNQVVDGLSLAVLEEIDGGDHSFKVKGIKQDETISLLANISASWIQKLL